MSQLVFHKQWYALGTEPFEGRSEKILFTDCSYGSLELFMCFLTNFLILVDASVQGKELEGFILRKRDRYDSCPSSGVCNLG